MNLLRALVFSTVLLVLVACVVLVAIETVRAARSNVPPIYCIMVTGKDPCRLELARSAFANFQSQTYPAKHMIIINHGHEKVLRDMVNTSVAYELMVDKSKYELNLGDLRNIALELVPQDALWITWDDDDYRHPDMLKTMYNAMTTSRSDAVFFTQRLEHNYNTSLTWKTTVRSGLVHGLIKKNPATQFRSVDTMEDIELIASLRSIGKEVLVIPDNRPEMYLRLVHGDNTSTYVDPQKNKLVQNAAKVGNYIEEPPTKEQETYVRNIMSSYYKDTAAVCSNKTSTK